MPIDDVTVGRIVQSVEEITEAKDRILSAIYDRDGLAERTLKIEQAAIRTKEVADTMLGFQTHTTEVIDKIEESTEAIKDSVEAHHKDKSLHTFWGLFLKKEIIIVILLAFIILHELIPPGINLWELLRKLIGV